MDNDDIRLLIILIIPITPSMRFFSKPEESLLDLWTIAGSILHCFPVAAVSKVTLDLVKNPSNAPYR